MVCTVTQGGTTPNAPLTFCGAISLSAAWFAYLRNDGVKILNFHFKQKEDSMSARFKRILQPHKIISQEAETAVEENDEDTRDAAAYHDSLFVNLVSGALLIAASFFI